jgi:hypothetical protein
MLIRYPDEQEHSFVDGPWLLVSLHGEFEPQVPIFNSASAQGLAELPTPIQFIASIGQHVSVVLLSRVIRSSGSTAGNAMVALKAVAKSNTRANLAGRSISSVDGQMSGKLPIDVWGQIPRVLRCLESSSENLRRFEQCLKYHPASSNSWRLNDGHFEKSVSAWSLIMSLITRRFKLWPSTT